MRIAVLGLGPLGQKLAAALSAKGHSIVVAARDVARSSKVAEQLGVAAAESDAEAAAEAEVVILAVHEDGLEARASRLADAGLERRVALHASGSLGAEVLGELERAGWSVGRLHPLVALCDASDPTSLEGASWSLAGGPEALARARELLACLAGREVHVTPGNETRYHAAAALVAAGAVALVEEAASSMEPALSGEDSKASARRALAGLLASIAANLDATTASEALTGPVARGAVTTLGAHLAELPEPTAGWYRAVLPSLARLVRERLDDDRREALDALLRSFDADA